QLLLWKFGENREVDPEFEPPALPEQARRRTERDATLAELQRLLRASPRAVTRLHALCALNELNALPSAMLVNAIDDPHPGVRRHAVRCAEPRIARKNDVGTLSPIRQALLDAIVRHARDDDDAQVRLQIACTLGASSQTSAAQALALIARQHGDDPFVVTAVLSSVRSDTVAMVLADVLKGAADPDPKRRPAETLVNRLLGLATAQAGVEHLPTIARQIATRTNDKYEAWQFAALVGMLDALPRRGVKLESQPFGDASGLVDQMIGAARATVVDSAADERARVAALALVGRQVERRQDDVRLLAELLSPRNSTELQAAAVAALGRIADPAVADVVVRNWSSHTPAMQSRVVDLLLSRDAWQRKLLDSLESRAIPASQIDAPRRQRLLAHKDAAVRARAERLFAGASNADRQRVVADYREAESLAGSRERGRPLFAKHCSACHRLGDVGH
ncbi:MAG TPA: hypothetical protein PLV92_24675, partial [Pirellulaceae bacterium]|nr:hypothetical protein [Pirellulaceae bacterium]